jgi:serine/threonine-protein phosphatase 5
MCDLLWADPAKTPGRTPSKRGISIGFGPDITKKFLQENNL